MAYTDVSIDLETLGVQPGSVITQIGLCAFDQRGGSGSMSSTRIDVDPQSMIDMGFKVDWNTVRWWLVQDETPRKRMSLQIGSCIHDALTQVRAWFTEHAQGGEVDRLRVWGHGSGFDCTQLEIAFQRCGLVVPWDFRKVRDLRTLADLRGAHDVLRPEPGVAHDAMEDATAQARWIRDLTYSVEKREQPQG